MYEVASTSTPRSSRVGDRREEAVMQDFVSKHMTHILQPVADHVRQLQVQVEHLESVIMSTSSRAAQTKEVSDNHSKEMRSVLQQLTHLNSRCQQQQTDLATTASEHALLHADHDRSKVQMRKLKAEVQSSEDGLKTIQERLQDLEGSCEEVSQAQSKMQEGTSDTARTVQQLEDGQKALMYKTLTLEEDQTGVSKKIASNQKSISDLGKRFELQRAEDLKTTATLADRLTYLEQMQGDVQRNITRIDGKIKQNEASIADLRHQATEAEQPVQQRPSMVPDLVDLEKLIADATETQEAQARFSRLDQVESDAQSFRKAYVVDQQNLKNGIESLGKQLASGLDTMQGLAEVQQKHNTMLRKSEWSISSLQGDIKKLTEQNANMEQEVGEHLPSWERELEAKMAVHTQSLQQVIGDMEQTRQEVVACDSRWSDASKLLASVAADLEKMGKSQDLCLGSLAGFSKGFQDMSRCVALGENGMLQPTRPTSALPRIRPTSAMAGTLPSARTPEAR